jgi:ABC-2 type transport system permease protein
MGLKISKPRRLRWKKYSWHSTIARINEAIMLNLLKHEIKVRWAATLGWGITLALFGTTYITIFPQVEQQIKSIANWEIYQAMGFDMGTFEGFLGSTVVLFIPLVLAIYVIINSTRTLAGEEDDGTLELLLAMPLQRWQIVSAKALAMGLSTFSILAIVGAWNGWVLNMMKRVVEVDITSRQLFVAVVNAWPLILTVAMIGLFLGAYLPTQRAASITLTVFFLASYFTENFASHLESLSALRPYSIFSYFDTSAQVFREGVQAKDVLILLGLAATFFGLALFSFQRRSVTVEAWPWQRTAIPQDQSD